jgi:Family of unknown function (DUF6518)
MRDHDSSDTGRAARGPARYRTAAPVVIALAAAAAFGGVDQYLGSRYSQFLTAVSGMSAPWLLLPFIVGACQPSRRRALVLGLAATWLAVGAYVMMIVSPVEGVHLTVRVFAVTTASQWQWFLGGLISGPLYGLLGYHWRARRSWPAALLATLPVMLEPVARWLAEHFGLMPWSSSVPAVYAEVMTGLALTIAVAAAIVRARTVRWPA